jgi:plasmid maintenance system antidote protein VapI
MSTPIADALKTAIKESGLTNYAIAKAAGIHQQVLSRWLDGHRDLTLKSADKIAAAIGLKVCGTESEK